MKIFKFTLLLTLLSLYSCTTISDQDLVYLNGYWEIEQVESHGEIFNPRGGNVLVDLYILDSMKGIRKKLAPSFGANYSSSEDQFNFVIEIIDEAYYIVYEDALKPWKEKIKSINEESLELEHSDKVYSYKRHKKISL